MLKLVQMIVDLDPPRSDGAEFIVEASVNVDFIAIAFPCPNDFRPHDGPWMKLIFKEGGDVTVKGRPRDLLEQPPAKEAKP